MGISVSTFWGSVSPQQVIGYKVVVVPKVYTEPCWEFLVLLPSGDEEQEDLAFISQICQIELKVGDTFSVYRLQQEEEQEYQDMPVMWVDDQTLEPEWLTPPVQRFH